MFDLKKTQVKELQLNKKIIYSFLIFVLVLLCYKIGFLIYELISLEISKINYLIHASFIIMCIAYLITGIYAVLYIVSQDCVILFSLKTVKFFETTFNILSLLLPILLIISLLLFTAFLALGLDLPYEIFKTFFIMSFFAVMPQSLFFMARIYYIRNQYYKNVVNPTLIYSFFLQKLNFHFFREKYDVNFAKKWERDNLYQTEIIVGEIEDEYVEKLYKIYNDTYFVRFEKFIKTWFVTLNMFIWSSFISLFATVIAWIIDNRTDDNITSLSVMLCLLIFVFLVLGLGLNTFSSKNNFHSIKEDDDSELEAKFSNVKINVLSKNLILNDKNLIFILGAVKKIILYLGAGYTKYIFSLTTNKNLKIIDQNKVLFLKIENIDTDLVLNFWYASI